MFAVKRPDLWNYRPNVIIMRVGNVHRLPGVRLSELPRILSQQSPRSPAASPGQMISHQAQLDVKQFVLREGAANDLIKLSRRKKIAV